MIQTAVKHSQNLLIAAFVSIFGVLFVAPPAHALFEGAKDEACKGANLSASDSDCRSEAATSKVDNTLQSIINILTTIIGVIAVIMIIVNGFRFITSNGDSGKVASARSGIIYAIVGLIVVALAQVIVRFVLSRV